MKLWGCSQMNLSIVVWNVQGSRLNLGWGDYGSQISGVVVWNCYTGHNVRDKFLHSRTLNQN